MRHVKGRITALRLSLSNTEIRINKQNKSIKEKQKIGAKIIRLNIKVRFNAVKEF